MLPYIAKRILYLIPILIGVSIISFTLTQISPGDPAEIILRESGIEPTKEAIINFKEEFKLNDSIDKQYIRWFKGALKGDFGVSYRTRNSVSEEIKSRFPATIKLALSSFVLVIIFSIPLGIISSLYKGTWIDHFSRAFALIGASLPSYFLALILIYFLALKLRLFPVMGMNDSKSLVLPSLTLALGMGATYSRLLRSSMLEILGQDFIVSARQRGIKESRIIIFNALRNALLPLITCMGINFGYLLGGTIIVENIFAWPGLGQFVMQGISTRDYPVIQAYVLCMSVIFVVINLLVDILYTFLDPRITLTSGSKI